MGYAIKGKLDGLEQTLRKLRGLKQAMQNRIMRKAVTAASREVQGEAKARAPVGETKLLRRSMGTVVKTYRGKNVVVAIVGPRTGFQRDRKGGKRQTALGAKFKATGHNPSKIAHLVERGHKIRRKKGGPILGVVRAHEFMRPAFERTKARAEVIVGRVIRDELLLLAAKK